MTTGNAQRGGIIGVVSDTLGVLIVNVQVILVDTRYATSTNDKGEFRLSKLKPGNYTLSMRRLGYAPFFVPIVVSDGDPTELAFELTPSEARLEPINVETERLSAKLRRVGFESRRRTSGVPASHFLTHLEIEQRNPVSLSQVVERMKGRSGSCTDPNVYMDGMPAFTNDNSTGPVRLIPRSASTQSRTLQGNFSKNRTLDNIPFKEVDGLEVYAGLSEIPAEFKMGTNGLPNDACVVLIWTRER